MQTQLSTIVGFLGELIDGHVQNSGLASVTSATSDIVSLAHKTKANVDRMVTDPDGILILTLDDGTEWAIIVEARN